tara:strand:- start:1720 stop:2733 length:1014 start_codon:yes stop_codon:yes gene_type:complete
MTNKKPNILITGATGSFGKAFVKDILEKNNYKRVVIYSRDELKQWEMSQIYSITNYPNIRYFIGDIRDKDRLKQALVDIDHVVHAAALKQVPAAEYNPFEFIKTNVIGSENLIRSCLESNVRKVVALSTDKAASPINLYGASKLCSDKLFIAANNIKGKKDISFSIVRYGNVMGSRGSVIPLFLKLKKTGSLPITDPYMTRFNIALSEGVQMVKWALKNALGGEILVPKIPSYRIKDLAEAIGPKCELEIVGIRSGEKIHEEMITVSDSNNTYDIGNYYSIIPSYSINLHGVYKQKGYKKVKENFSYNSGTNEDFLSISEIRDLIKLHIDKDFNPYE